MKCALYLHHLNNSHVYKEVMGDSVDVQAEALYLAMRDFASMSDSMERQNFCFEVLHHQRSICGGNKPLVALALRNGYQG